MQQARYTEIHNLPDLKPELIFVSTEDGRILIYSADQTHSEEVHISSSTNHIPNLAPIGQIVDESKSRIKDFEILEVGKSQNATEDVYVVSASSNGAIRVLSLDIKELFADAVTLRAVNQRRRTESENNGGGPSGAPTNVTGSALSKPIVKILGTYETGHRITCLKAFLMSAPLDARPKHVSTLSNGKYTDDNDTANEYD